MPKLDGHELLRLFKTKHPDVPFIIETGIADPSVRAALMRDGAYDYLLKPFERDRLLTAVRRALEYRRLTFENRSYQTNLEQLVTARTEQLRQAVRTLRWNRLSPRARGRADTVRSADRRRRRHPRCANFGSALPPRTIGRRGAERNPPQFRNAIRSQRGRNLLGDARKHLGRPQERDREGDAVLPGLMKLTPPASSPLPASPARTQQTPSHSTPAPSGWRL